MDPGEARGTCRGLDGTAWPNGSPLYRSCLPLGSYPFAVRHVPRQDISHICNYYAAARAAPDDGEVRALYRHVCVCRGALGRAPVTAGTTALPPVATDQYQQPACHWAPIPSQCALCRGMSRASQNALPGHVKGAARRLLVTQDLVPIPFRASPTRIRQPSPHLGHALRHRCLTLEGLECTPRPGLLPASWSQARAACTTRPAPGRRCRQGNRKKWATGGTEKGLPYGTWPFRSYPLALAHTPLRIPSRT